MINNTLSKQTASLLCALFMLAPVPAAVAWDEVCVDFIQSAAWFRGLSQVLYGFDQMPPARERQADGDHIYAYEHLRALRSNVFRRYEPYRKRQYNARGWTDWGALIDRGQQRCVSIRGIRKGEKFVVYLLPDSTPPHRGIFCETHVSNPNIFYVQQERPPYRKLWYWVWGHASDAKCKFHHEE